MPSLRDIRLPQLTMRTYRCQPFIHQFYLRHLFQRGLAALHVQIDPLGEVAGPTAGFLGAFAFLPTKQ